MPELQRIEPHAKDLGGGFMVRRLLPSAKARSVGPFVFFDHFGPVTAGPDDNFDVRPHPHIGLATVTYLFEGAMQHRDSLGSVQRIEPGAINWMTAGRGIVHSERTPQELRSVVRRSHGLQLWTALPADREEDPPSFSHTPASQIPQTHVDGAHIRVLVGAAFGLASPVKTLSPTLVLDIALAPGARLAVPDLAEEVALYGVDEGFELDGVPVPAFTMAVLESRGSVQLRAERGARIALVGGAPLGPRFIAWNFVSSRKDRIAQAEGDWQALTTQDVRADETGRGFDPVPGETDFIPLPPRRA